MALRHPREQGQGSEDFAPIALSWPIPRSLHQHFERGPLINVATFSCSSHPSEAISRCIGLQRPPDADVTPARWRSEPAREAQCRSPTCCAESLELCGVRAPRPVGTWDNPASFSREKRVRRSKREEPIRSRVGVDDAEGFARLPAFQVGRAAPSNRNGVLRVEDALGLLFLCSELLARWRPPRLPSPDPQALEHDFV